MTNTPVKEIMKTAPVLINPDATLKEAAKKMKEVDCGFLPVGTDNTPTGIITDRDIVIRAIADGLDPEQEKVRDHMTREVCSCHDSDPLEKAAMQMRENNVSRLVVLNDEGSFCGVLTYGRIMRNTEDQEEKNKVVERAIRTAA